MKIRDRPRFPVPGAEHGKTRALLQDRPAPKGSKAGFFRDLQGSARHVARDISARAAAIERATDIDTIVAALSSAYAPDAPLANALREDWLRGRGDKTARLAIAWAREQVRLALSEVLQRSRALRPLRTGADVEVLAPESLRSRVAESLKQATSRYE